MNSITDHHNTPLMIAADQGHDKCMEELINAGADVNKVDLDGDTAMMCAAITGKGNCISTLIEAGADVNIANKNGYVPIMCFARNGDDESITELIMAGADVNIVNNLGETAMTIARSKGNFKCIGLLVQEGAIVNVNESLPGNVNNEKKPHVLDAVNSSNMGQSSGSNYEHPGGASASFIPPTAPDVSDLNEGFDIEEPPPYEELFPFMLK